MNRQSEPQGSGHYFVKYQRKLEPLVGMDAATVLVAFHKWVLGFIVALLVGVGFAAFGDPGSSLIGLLGVVAAFLVAVCCGVIATWLSARGGRLAATYLARELGRPVRNPGVKISVRWWSEFVDRERHNSP